MKRLKFSGVGFEEGEVFAAVVDAGDGGAGLVEDQQA